MSKKSRPAKRGLSSLVATPLTLPAIMANMASEKDHTGRNDNHQILQE